MAPFRAEAAKSDGAIRCDIPGYNTPEVRFFAAVGEEPEIEVALA